MTTPTTPIIVFVIYVVIQLVAKLKEAGKAKGASPPPAPGDLGQDERTRRIQAEIRRKIQERSGGGRPAPEPGPAPGPAREMVAREKPPLDEAADPVPEAPRAPVRLALDQELERQRRLAAQLAALAARRTPAADEPAVALAGDRAQSFSTPANTLRESLRDPAGLRRAVILREILDVPVGLR